MLSVLAEQPLLLSFLWAVTGGALVYGYLQSGEKKLGVAGAVFLALIPVTWVVSSRMVTDREKILQIIHETASAVEANDVETAVRSIQNPDTRRRAQQEVPRYEFHKIQPRNIQIEFVEGSYPPEATADMDVSVRLSQRNGPMKNQGGSRRLIVTFQQQSDGNWVVTDYNHRPLVGPPDAFSQVK